MDRGHLKNLEGVALDAPDGPCRQQACQAGGTGLADTKELAAKFSVTLRRDPGLS
jgi:hypothetical protein